MTQSISPDLQNSSQREVSPKDVRIDLTRQQIIKHLVDGKDRTTAIDMAVAWAKESWQNRNAPFERALENILARKNDATLTFLNYTHQIAHEDIFLWARAAHAVVEMENNSEPKCVAWIRARMQEADIGEYEYFNWFAIAFRPLPDKPCRRWAERTLCEALALTDFSEKGKALTWLEQQLRHVNMEAQRWFQEELGKLNGAAQAKPRQRKAKRQTAQQVPEANPS